MNTVKLILTSILSLIAVHSTHASTKPNIIVIYTDDQGYGDISAMNPECKFQTPNLDRLVTEGISFTNGHSSDSVCTPSRYSLLTGRYCWRTTRKTGVLGSDAKCLIKNGRMTLASMLRDQGYNTAMVGKWHLGMQFPKNEQGYDWSKPVQDMPLDKGFDYFYGIPASLNYGILAWFEGRHAKVPPTLWTRKKKNPIHVDYRIKPPYQKTAKSKADILTAPDFIDNQCLTGFTDKAIKWLDSKTAEAKSGKPFFLYLPYTSPHYPVCPLPEFQDQGKAGAYGAFMVETDHHIGRILNFLKTSGLDDDTLIFFSSDNGPERSWKQRIKDFDHDSRGGYREGKRSAYEGGHRVPFIVRWPAGIKNPGRQWNGLVGQTDLLATFADLLGKKLPDNAGEDSQSFYPVLLDPETNHKRLPLINHGNTGNRYTITEGNWKLLLPSKKNRATDKIKPVELYDLSIDPAEKNNLAAKHPQKVKSLQDKITKIIVNGRTTPGTIQKNDTGYWTDLTWMTKSDFNK